MCSLFASGTQFRQWVALGRDGSALVAEFPGETASASAAIFGGLDLLRRRGRLDAAFFDRLVARAPARSDEIAAVAAVVVASADPSSRAQDDRPRATVYTIASDPSLGSSLATRLRDGLIGSAVEISMLPSEALAAAPPPLKPASYLVYLGSPAAPGLPGAWIAELTRMEVVLLTAGVGLPVSDGPALHVRLTATGGHEPVLAFLREELTEQARPVARADQTLLRGVSRRVLRLVARHCIDDVTLDSFLFDAELEPGRIRGNSLHERLIDLLHLADAEGLLAHFSEFLVDERERCVRTQLARMGEVVTPSR